MAVWNLKHFTVLTLSDQGSTVTIDLGPGPKNFQHGDVQEGFVDAIDDAAKMFLPGSVIRTAMVRVG